MNIMKTWDTYQAVIFTSAIWYHLLALNFTWMKYLNVYTIYFSIFVINDNSQLTIMARILVLNGGSHLGFYLILALYSFLSHNWICIFIYYSSIEVLLKNSIWSKVWYLYCREISWVQVKCHGHGQGHQKHENHCLAKTFKSDIRINWRKAYSFLRHMTYMTCFV